MKLKKFLMLNLTFIFIILGTINVNATEYGYGYYYRDWVLSDENRFWNPSNEQKLKKEGFWVDDMLLLEVDSEGKVTLPISEHLVKITDDIYELNMENTYGTIFANVKKNGDAIYYGLDFEDAHRSTGMNLILDNTPLGVLYELFNVSGEGILAGMYEQEYEYTQLYDFSHLNNYYDTHGKMPEVIVACEYRTKKANNYYIDIKEEFAGLISSSSGKTFAERLKNIVTKNWDNIISFVTNMFTTDIKDMEQITVFYVDDLQVKQGTEKEYGFDIKNMYVAPYEFQLLITSALNPTTAPVGIGIIGLAISRGVEYNVSNCYYFAQNKNASLNACYSFEDYMTELENLANQHSCKSSEFLEKYNELVGYCQVYSENNGTAIIDENGNKVERACSVKCQFLEDYKKNICGEYNDNYRCGSIGTKLAAWLMRILKIIRYIVPVLVIVLSVLDFIGAIASANDDAMKKASQKFTKRIIATIVLFLLPVILQFLFDIFNIAGLESGNPFCMK